jgi:hypothetical protein
VDAGSLSWFTLFFKDAGVVVVQERPAVDPKHFKRRPQAVINESRQTHSNIACRVTRSTSMCDKRVGTRRCRAHLQQTGISTYCLPIHQLISTLPSQHLPSWANATSSSPSRESTTAIALWPSYIIHGSMATVLCDNVFRPCVS